MPLYSTTVDISSWKDLIKPDWLAKLHDDGSVISKGKKLIFLNVLKTLPSEIWANTAGNKLILLACLHAGLAV